MATKTISFTQGEDVSVTIQLTDKNNLDANGNPQPFPLPGFTSCTASFPAVTGGGLPIMGTLLSSDLGKLNFALNEVATAAVSDGDEQNIEVVVDRGATRTIAQVLGKLNVAKRLFT